ncbi:hypothetical protein D9M68_981880 [compost metagenome]
MRMSKQLSARRAEQCVFRPCSDLVREGAIPNGTCERDGTRQRSEGGASGSNVPRCTW